MSLIGAKPITLADGVSLTVSGSQVVVKGSKGELTQNLPLNQMEITNVDQKIIVKRKSETKEAKAFHGLVRSIIQNMVTGVTQGFEKRLELVGTGYRVQKQGNKIVLSLGYSHPIEYLAPTGITLEVEGNNIVIVKGADKQAVGQVAAEIRAKRPPEPYKGKGVKYENEFIRRKAGKTAAA